MRTFTVRRFEPASGELDIDFVLHGEGPASQWADLCRSPECLSTDAFGPAEMDGGAEVWKPIPECRCSRL